jgi:hypothetical protein
VLPPKRVFATTVLRKFNQQWRVVIHHAARFTSSPYTGDQKKIPVQVQGVSGTSRGKKQIGTKIGEKTEKDFIQKGELSLSLSCLIRAF